MNILKACTKLVTLTLCSVSLIIPNTSHADYCCDQDYSWIWCAGLGAIFGAAAGAGTGYAAGHNRGKSGKKGRIGPTGPTGPTGPAGPGFETNTTDALVITGENLVLPDNTTTYALWIEDPIGNPIYTQSNVTVGVVFANPLVNIPAGTAKFEGTYSVHIIVQAEDMSGAITPLGEFQLNGLAMLPVDISNDPAASIAWTSGEVAIVSLPFP